MRAKQTILVAAALSMVMAGTAFAGTWKNGARINQKKWWYDNGDGSYACDGWQWIDGNGDGVAECYYFDGNGWMLADTKTPDGYSVNGNGAWTENGNVQTKVVKVAPISKDDFIVSGDNNAFRSTPDHSVITYTEMFEKPFGWASYSLGDSMVTARGVPLGGSKKDVLEKYGNIESRSFIPNEDDVYMAVNRKLGGTSDAATIARAASSLDYCTSPYGIKFYFDQQDVLIGVIFYSLNYFVG